MANPSRRRQIFANRTLNLRAIRAIGYDMDYTLIHYLEREWERTAYTHAIECLSERGWPLASLTFEPTLMIRGLVIDTLLGNILKANRFGFMKRAFHGSTPLAFEDMRRTYARTIVDLSDPRFHFMNTLFSLSEACLYAQLVDLVDQGALPDGPTYAELYRIVRETFDGIHMEGRLKQEISRDPERFVDLDPETATAILDQRGADKKLLLITNSEWSYTEAMMTFAFDRFLQGGMSWRDLFDITIVEARKPDFFLSKNALFQIVREDGLLRPCPAGIRVPGVYLGGSAQHVEKALGLAGEEILYVGDHIFSDVHVTKNILRWRTALVLRELEEEIDAVEAISERLAELGTLMAEKEALERSHCATRLALQHQRLGFGEPSGEPTEALLARAAVLRDQLAALDARISPLAKAATEAGSTHWGLLLRAGNDKSHLARQLERYADVYTSRVSNFALATPFAYLRSVRGSLPHD